jgi:hypothetical protein
VSVDRLGKFVRQSTLGGPGRRCHGWGNYGRSKSPAIVSCSIPVYLSVYISKIQDLFGPDLLGLELPDELWTVDCTWIDVSYVFLTSKRMAALAWGWRVSVGRGDEE